MSAKMEQTANLIGGVARKSDESYSAYTNGNRKEAAKKNNEIIADLKKANKLIEGRWWK